MKYTYRFFSIISLLITLFAYFQIDGDIPSSYDSFGSPMEFTTKTHIFWYTILLMFSSAGIHFCLEKKEIRKLEKRLVVAINHLLCMFLLVLQTVCLVIRPRIDGTYETISPFYLLLVFLLIGGYRLHLKARSI